MFNLKFLNEYLDEIQKDSSAPIQPIAGTIKGFIPFPKVFVYKWIAHLEFKLAYYDSAVQHFNHYNMGHPTQFLSAEMVLSGMTCIDITQECWNNI